MDGNTAWLISKTCVVFYYDKVWLNSVISFGSTKVFQCRGTNGFRRQDEKCSLFPAAERREVGTSMHAPSSFAPHSSYGFGGRPKVVDAASAEEQTEQQSLWSPASFNSDVWKHFGFPVKGDVMY